MAIVAVAGVVAVAVGSSEVDPSAPVDVSSAASGPFFSLQPPGASKHKQNDVAEANNRIVAGKCSTVTTVQTARWDSSPHRATVCRSIVPVSTRTTVGVRWIGLISFALVFACEASDEEAACLGRDEPARVTLENRTGNAMETIFMVDCDLGQMQEFPVPPGGLADGEDLTFNLPGPGCWILDYAGEGCVAEPKHRVDEVCSGETHVWTATDETHACVGGT
jgi:hypothetical protein